MYAALPLTLKSFELLTEARAKTVDVTKPTSHKKKNGFINTEYFHKDI